MTAETTDERLEDMREAGKLPYFFASLISAILAGGVGGIMFLYIGLSVPQAPLLGDAIFSLVGFVFLVYFTYMILNRRIWRAAFYKDEFAYGRLSMKAKMRYEQIQRVETAHDRISARTLVLLYPYGSDSPLVIPSNPRSPVLHVDLAAWLLKKVAKLNPRLVGTP